MKKFQYQVCLVVGILILSGMTTLRAQIKDSENRRNAAALIREMSRERTKYLIPKSYASKGNGPKRIFPEFELRESRKVWSYSGTRLKRIGKK